MDYDAKSIALMLDNIPTKDSVTSLLDGIKGIDVRLADLGNRSRRKSPNRIRKLPWRKRAFSITSCPLNSRGSLSARL